MKQYKLPEWALDYKFGVIILGFIIIIVCLLIQKIDFTIIEKSDECVCKCVFEDKPNYNLSINWTNWGIKTYNSSINYSDNCIACWSSNPSGLGLK